MRKLLIPILMLLFLAFCVSAINQTITLATTTIQNITKNISLSSTFTINITNRGNVPVNFSATLTNFTLGSSQQNITNILPYTSFSGNLTVNETNQTQITASIPLINNVTPGTYTAILTVFYNNGTFDNSKNETLTLSLTVKQAQASVTITPSTISFNFSDRDTYFIQVLTIQNTGDYDLNEANISVLSIASKYNMNISNSTNTSKLFKLYNISIGNSKTATIRGFIPDDQRAETFGSIQFDSQYDSRTLSSSIGLSMTSQSMLRINQVKASVNGGTDTVNNNGDKIEDDASPKDTVKLKIEVENLYDENTDEDISDIDDIKLEVTVKGIDEDNEDIELEADKFTLAADDKKEIELDFEVPLRLIRGEYDIDIDVEGEDGSGTEHSDSWVVGLGVVKESHEIRIQKSELTPSELSCTRRGNLDISIINTGKNDEKDVLVTAKNSALGLSFLDDGIELQQYEEDEEDDIYDMIVSIDATDKAPRTYPVQIRIYQDEDHYYENADDYIAVKTVDAVVRDCLPEAEEGAAEGEAEAEEEQQPEAQPPVTTTTTTTTPATGAAETITGEATGKLPFKETTSYVALLLLGNLVILMVVIALVAKFILLMKRP